MTTQNTFIPIRNNAPKADETSVARNVPIEELIRPPSKRQMRRTKYIQKKTVTRASGSAEKREGRQWWFPRLPQRPTE